MKCKQTRNKIIYWINIFILFFYLSGCKSSSDEIPYAEISNGLVKAKLYLPDAETGYYQGTRFDWSGVIPELEYEGHAYFGQWFAKYDPKKNDAICGPVEEFSPIGFEEANPDDEFLQIGIGGLKKPDNEKHNRFGLYEISNPGKWSVKKSSDNVSFTHKLNNVAGYSYVYTKTVRLTEGKPELVLKHTLKNTGKQTITTDVYNHNFFTIDNQHTGTDIVVKFPFQVFGDWEKEDSLAICVGNEIVYSRNFEPRESVFMSNVQGHTQSLQDYDFRIENRKTGAGVRITGDKPVSKIVYWASAKTSCPEPYIDIEIQPGEEFSWNIVYEFYVFEPFEKSID